MIQFRLKTQYPFALDSRDHIVPGGTMMDDTGDNGFLEKAYALFHPVRPFALLDLGCSSGAIVQGAIRDGRIAAGLEGSDYSLTRRRGAWANLAGNALFTCDITKPFLLSAVTYHDQLPASSGSTVTPQPFRFDVVTSWEVMEHIGEDGLDQLITNVLSHLMPDGIWAMSISQQEGFHHRTVRGREWWLARFAQYGLGHDQKVLDHFGTNLPRGLEDPSSFHLMVRRTNFYAVS
jgi:hypothetical protein